MFINSVRRRELHTLRKIWANVQLKQSFATLKVIVAVTCDPYCTMHNYNMMVQTAIVIYVLLTAYLLCPGLACTVTNNQAI